MFRWGEINSGETIIFTKIILLREQALERAKCVFFFCLSYINEESSRRLVLQLQLILPKKLTVLKAL